MLLFHLNLCTQSVSVFTSNQDSEGIGRGRAVRPNPASHSKTPRRPDLRFRAMSLFPGLHSWQPEDRSLLEGLILVRIDRAVFRWQPKKPFLELRLIILEPKAMEERAFYGRLYCTEKARCQSHGRQRDLQVHHIEARSHLGEDKSRT